MNEHEVSQTPSLDKQATKASESLPVRPAPERGDLDWRRLKVASARFEDMIAGGIGSAVEELTGIGQSTAQCIAHAFGRAFGRMSALATYGRTCEGDYVAIRDEYLQLYNSPEAPAWVVEQVDWLGTYLIRAQHPDAQTLSDHEPYPLTLEEILVPTNLAVGDWSGVAHVPGIYDSTAVASLRDTLEELRVDKDPGLQAYLSLPNVNAMSGDITEGFHNTFIAEFPDEEEALHAVCDLDDREREITQLATARHLYFDYLTPDYEALREEVRDLVDLVELGGRTYVFYK